jgi:hypothetical protein
MWKEKAFTSRMARQGHCAEFLGHVVPSVPRGDPAVYLLQKKHPADDLRVIGVAIDA